MCMLPISSDVLTIGGGGGGGAFCPYQNLLNAEQYENENINEAGLLSAGSFSVQRPQLAKHHQRFIH